MSLLRELIDEDRFRDDPAAALLDAALIVLRGHLENLVTDPTRSEAIAMAAAGERLAEERAALLARAIKNPELALAAFDGGRALDEVVMDRALALAAGRS